MRQIYGMASSPTPRGATVALILGGAGLALALYIPWVRRPFDILDFSEFLPLFRRESGFGGRFAALVDYAVHEHGRLNILSYAALAAKWSLLGDSPVLWQWLRFLEMGLLVAGIYALARRLDASWLGAAAGSALFLTSRSGEQAWIRLTMGEPLGLGLMLGAALVVTSERAALRSGIRTAAASVLVAAAILAKEMLVGWVPLLLLLGLCYRNGGLGPPVRDLRSRHLVLGVGAATVASMLAVILAATSGSAESFTASYQMQSFTLPRLAALWNRIVMPQSTLGHASMWLHPANLLFAITCLGGLSLALRRPEERRQALLMAAVGAGLPAIGALLYVPWPYFNAFYALPFLVGPALLLATAVTAAERQAPRARWAAYAGAAGMALFAAVSSAYAARATIARQQVNGELARSLPAYASVDSIVVAQEFAAPQKWQGTGPTLVRYALAVGAATTLPPAVDASCRESRALLDGRLGNTLLISYLDQCGGLPGASRRVARYFSYPDYTRFAVATDSVVADLLAP